MSNAAPRRRAQAVMAGVFPVAVALVAASASASPAQADTQHHGSTGNSSKVLTDAHPAWATADKERGAVPAAQQISTRIYLTGQDPAGLAAAARAASDPHSAGYQHYLTPAQIQARFGATPAQVAAVQQWLTGAGLKVSGVSSDWIEAVGDAAAVQRAFGTPIKDYQSADGTVKYAAASAAVIPAGVAGYVAGVSGLSQASARVHADSAKANALNAGNGADSATANCSPTWGTSTTTAWPAGSNPGPTALLPCSYTPQQLRDAYGVTKSGLTGKGATIAVVDWYGSANMLGDADKFATAHGDKAFAPGQYTDMYDSSQWANQNLCGGTDGVAAEEALDVEMTHGLAPDANIVYVGANSCFDADLMAAEQKIVDNHLADVVSNSWGEIMHTSDGQDMDPSSMAAWDRIFEKGALEGIGFDFSTGDCGDDDPANAAGGGANCASDSARKQTEWPASSAWVTAVGGTTLATDAGGHYAWEAAMGDHTAVARQGDAAWSPGPGQGQTVPFSFFFGGGGGTSEDVAQPFYQAGVVPSALANGGHDSTRPMRTLPDVAMNGALASSVLVGMTGMKTAGVYDEGGMGGTSVAAPEFSALQADAKQAAGGRALGFANPSLYALGGSSAFHDVTAHPAGQPQVLEGIYVSGGDPTYGEMFHAGQDTSLTAAAGYDTATGLGSPADDYLAKIATVAPLTPPATPSAPVVRRVAGADRYGTAITVSQSSFPKAGSASAVVLATGETFPDALSGVPLATEKGGPLLLTPSQTPSAAVVAEIHRVLAPGGTVYVLGGERAVSDKVVAALGLPASQVTRVAGADRFGTSLAIAGRLDNPAGNVVLATGNDFADALTAGPFSAVYGGGTGSPAAILLTDGRRLTPAVAGFVAGAHSVAAVGGQAVSAAAGLPNRDAHAQFAGYDRYATASMVAGTFAAPKTVGVATGTRFADALTGAAMLAAAHSPLLLTDPVRLPDGTAATLHGFSQALSGGSVEIFGGPAAVSDAVVRQVANAVGGRVAP